MTWVPLRDSLSNPSPALLRLLAALEARGKNGDATGRASARDAVVEQAGADDPALVRLEVKENRMLSPGEVAELVEAYRHGATERSLAKRFGVHRQTVSQHLARAGVAKRPVVKMTERRIAQARELYEQGGLTTQEIGSKLGVSQSTVWNALKRAGVQMRPAVPRGTASEPSGELSGEVATEDAPIGGTETC